MKISSEYNGEANVTVGNWSGFSGYSHRLFLHSYWLFLSFILSNLLWVPHLSSNLLCVHQFCVDNNCLFLFYANSFTIQVKQMGQILFHGLCINSLYPSTTQSRPIVPNHITSQLGTKVHNLLWHDQLDHPNHSTLTSILRLLNVTISPMNFSCIHYLNGKTCKLSFHKS